MKKIISIILCLQIFILPAYCQIEDMFVKTSLNQNLKIKNQQNILIDDNLVQTSLDKSLIIKPYNTILIDDVFAENNKNKNYPLIKQKDIFEIIPVLNEENKTRKKITNFDFLNSQKIKIKIKKPFTTKHNINEGSCIYFETIEDNIINNIKYNKGTTIVARIENISKNTTMGVPSELIIGNFSINDISLQGEIKKTGANRSLWVYPLVCVGMLFFCAGIIFIPIRGGHAKIKSKEIYTLYYVPIP